ncbi:GNAT family protein [Neomicrococcus aestuarii]
MSAKWPQTMEHESVGLRPLRLRDKEEWLWLRRTNEEWLGPWEATRPVEEATFVTFRQMVKNYDAEAKAGRLLPFVVTYEGRMVGQLSVSGIMLGAARSGQIGYWIGHQWAGLGIMPTAVALAMDYCFFDRDLHRIEINIRPENQPSLRIVEKLGLRDEGLRKSYLHINGAWTDHRSFALTREEVQTRMIDRLGTHRPSSM